MVGWHHRHDGHEFEQAPGVGDGQRSLACCSPWGCKESDTTERLNWTDWGVCMYMYTHTCIWITLLYTWNKHNINYTSIKNFLNICKPINPKGNQSWIFTGGTDAEAEAPILLATEEPTHWKRPWCWERLKAGGEGGDRGWEGWMASPTQWTWVYASSGSWWWAGRPGVLLSVGWQRVGHDWVTKQQDAINK